MIGTPLTRKENNGGMEKSPIIQMVWRTIAWTSAVFWKSEYGVEPAIVVRMMLESLTGSERELSTSPAYLPVMEFGTSGIDDRLQSLGIQYGGTGAVESRDKSGCGSALFFPAAN